MPCPVGLGDEREKLMQFKPKWKLSTMQMLALSPLIGRRNRKKRQTSWVEIRKI